MRRLLVNDAMNQLGEHTFWNDLQEWFSMEFVGGDFNLLSNYADFGTPGIWGCDGSCQSADHDGHPGMASLIVRNASYFKPIKASETIPTISLLQDIFPDGPMREMQEKVVESSKRVVFNSEYTRSKYPRENTISYNVVIPLPIDFSVFEPGNAMGLQQELALPDGCVCWVGASQGAAGQVKGWDIFLQVVRANPDIPFVAVVKDAFPDTVPPNLRVYCRLKHDELVRVIGACRVGLCTSRTESQHLAGIEMGACGLPLVVPNVGTYWNRKDWPGITVMNHEVSAFTTAVRGMLGEHLGPNQTREYWKHDFDHFAVRSQWERLVAEVENADSNKV